ncbi:glutathione S-transferase [Alphaproteobacteria bacterium]|nr:glutathione S-transferase [Alphaproteobacteria bacterium]
MLLYHHDISVASRKIRLALAEKGLDFNMRMEKTWELNPEFLSLNPAGDVPVLVVKTGDAICGGQVIAEYLDEVFPSAPLIHGSSEHRAEIRRLCAWFDRKMAREVMRGIVGERLTKILCNRGNPDYRAIKAGRLRLKDHMLYMAWLLERRHWLAGGDDISLADLSAGAALSLLDYLGEVPWEDWPEVRLWYGRLKSRPCFRGLLADRIVGFAPASGYADLDF